MSKWRLNKSSEVYNTSLDQLCPRGDRSVKTKTLHFGRCDHLTTGAVSQECHGRRWPRSGGTAKGLNSGGGVFCFNKGHEEPKSVRQPRTRRVSRRSRTQDPSTRMDPRSAEIDCLRRTAQTVCQAQKSVGDPEGIPQPNFGNI